MDEAKRLWVRSWLIKAWSDLRSARALADLKVPATDTAGYHCQQAAEKALKGYLAFHDRPLERTHDLDRLLELAVEIDPEFEGLRSQVEELNPYATAFRYPGASEELFPPIGEVHAAINYAGEIYEFVMKQLPADVASTEERDD